jgi:hemoglobin
LALRGCAAIKQRLLMKLRATIGFATQILATLSCGMNVPQTKSAAPPVASAPAASPAQAAQQRSLYERLGGEPAITAVVDAFLKRVAGDKRINGRFFNTDLGRLRVLLIQFVSSATGGHVAYTGREMHTAHAGFQIVDEEFNALVEDLAGALAELKVPNTEQNELLGALGPLKPQIVNPPPASAAVHDPALAAQAKEAVAALRREGATPAADLLEVAVVARVRGQRSYADQLYSGAEALLARGRLDALASFFREGAPERITTGLKKMPQDTPAQPKLAVGGSDDESPEQTPRASFSGQVTIDGSGESLGVIALDPIGGRAAKRKAKQRVMEQRERQFAPRLLAIPVGSTVSFPNFDPVYHNVFSLSPSRAFDLGIYKNGETREVTFQKEGLIRLGCNLHANMSAHVVVVAAPHYVVTDEKGRFRFRSLTPGKYRLRAWGENSTEPVARTIEIHGGENWLNLSIPRGAVAGLGTDKFGVPRGHGGG